MKKNFISMLLSFLMTFFIFLTMFSVNSMAEMNPAEEEAGYYNFNEEFVQSQDLMALDWKNCEDEALSHAILMKEYWEVGMWLSSMSKEDVEELLSRDTVLIQEITVCPAEESNDERVIEQDAIVNTVYYQYALDCFRERKDDVYASYPAKSTGYWTLKVVNAATKETRTMQIKVSGLDTNTAISKSQKVTIAATGNGVNWCGLSMIDDSGSTYAYNSDSSYMIVRAGITLNKPAGYVGTVSYSDYQSTYGSWLYGLFWSPVMWGKNLEVYMDLSTKTMTESTNRRGYLTNSQMSSYNESTWSGQHQIVSLVNIYANGGVGTENITAKNVTQTITFSPIAYNVNYNGNGATSGSVASQNCTYGTTYTTQQNGYTRAYTVTYNGNGGTPAVNSQTASYAFKGWGMNQASAVNYLAGKSYSNLTSKANGTVNMYALWNPASIKLPTATRVGYTFDRWNIGTAGLNYTPTSNVTAVAQWTPNTYKIVLDGNGGTLSGSDSQTLAATYDIATVLPVPEREGYTFEGWIGEGGVYREYAKNLTATNGGTVRLTASWSEKSDTPYKIIRMYQKEEGVEDYESLDKKEAGKEEICYGVTGETITVPAVVVEGYETPQAQMITIAPDGSSRVIFYYKLAAAEKNVTYSVRHYIKTSPKGNYVIFNEQTLSAKEGTVVTPVLNKAAIEIVNNISGCGCKEPSLQTLTVTEGLVVKYYYDCVEKVAEGLPLSLQVDGVNYDIVTNEDGTLGIRFTSATETKVVIPDVITYGGRVYRITEICEKAFANNTKIKEVVLSPNINKISASAFEGCKNLKKITLQEGLVNIGDKAFKNCGSLTSISFPTTTQIIGVQAFYGCKSLKKVTLNEGLLMIEKDAFYRCVALAKLTIPKTVLKIGSRAFALCNKIKTVTFRQGSQLTELGSSAFYKNVSLEKITLPNKLAKVPTKCFYGCSKLNSLKIGNAVTAVESQAFRNCKKLTKISGGKNIVSIGKNAFRDCKSIQRVTVASKVQNIQSYAFYGCSKLKKVTVKSKVLTSVGKNAFKRCKKGIKFYVPASKKTDYIRILKGKY